MTTHAAPLASTTLKLRTGQYRLKDYFDDRFDRMQELNPDLQAFLPETNRDSRLTNEINTLRDLHPDPSARPSLYGIPVGIKDIIHVDGFMTKAGSALPPEELTGPEATCVERLREAGALIMGKTVTTEFAAAAPGPTRNPHNHDHTPGGSSSGSAAAVAAGLCPLALGSQTGGSVIRPAAFCGIVGFKPSYERIPIDGVIPFSTSADHVGLFTQDIDGAALAASVLCTDWQDVSRANRKDTPTLGLPADAYLENASDAGRDAFDETVTALADAGYTIKDTTILSDIDAVQERHRNMMYGEMALVHDDWFADYESRYREPTVERIANGQEITTGEIIEGRNGRDALREEVQQTPVDIIIAPAAPGPAPEGLESTGNSIMNLPWTHAGVPAMTLPAGWVDDLPVGLQLITQYDHDERLFSYAKQIATDLDLNC